MNNVPWQVTYKGYRVIEDRFAFKEEVTYKTVTIGIADRNKPNSRFMLHKNVRKRIVKRTPIAVLVNLGNEQVILIHPDLMRALQKHLRDSVDMQLHKYEQLLFGIDPGAEDGDKTVISTMPTNFAEFEMEFKLTEERLQLWKSLMFSQPSFNPSTPMFPPIQSRFWTFP